MITDLANVNLSELNDTEIRALCKERMGRSQQVSPWTPRQELVAFLLDGVPLGKNPLDEVRMHQMCRIIDRFAFYGPMLPCDGNCFDHEDLQVVECQVQNSSLRHPNYPKTEKDK